MADFSKTVTLPDGWTNLAVLMRSHGYTGGNPLTRLMIREADTIPVYVKLGHTSATIAPVTTFDGFAVVSATEIFEFVDAGVCWIYTAGGDVAIAASSTMDY